MTSLARRIGRWALGLLLALLLAAAVWIGVIVFPAPLFAHSESFGSYRVYSDEPLADDFTEVIDDLDRRVGAMEGEPRRARQRIYLCDSRRYALFAFLLRKGPESLAIGLSVTNQSFVSRDRLRLFATLNRGRLRHTRFEGRLAEAVAHEIAHFVSIDSLGYRAHLAQPLWKSEGWAEYQANLAPIRADPEYDLSHRIEQLLDDAIWGGDRSSPARWMWEAQLVVEYLGQVEGYRLAELVRDDVTRADARDRMLTWHRNHTGH